MIKQFINLDESEMELKVCKYLTFPKFINLLSFSAIWFSKLRILQDEYEGKTPSITKKKILEEHQKWKDVFPPDLHNQIDMMHDGNEDSGRELTMVSCWFLGEPNSSKMWQTYSDNSGVAIHSTIGKLTQHIALEPKISHIGKVKYVDMESYEMSNYEAHQACQRAFLKDKKKYAEEKEIRIATMSLKHPDCLKMNGSRYSVEEVSGKNMNNFENPGMYFLCRLDKLVDGITFAPKAPDWVKFTIKRILDMSRLDIPR